MKIFLFAWFLLSGYGLSAQYTFTEESAKALFENSADQLWVKSYTGLLDYYHPIEMILATDGDDVKGFYKMGADKLVYLIEGNKTEDDMQLIEFDENHHLTARIELNGHNGDFIGTWSESEIERNLPLRFTEKNINSSHFDDYKRMFYYTVYEGLIAGKLIDVNVYRQGDALEISLLEKNNLLEKDLINCNSDPCYYSLIPESKWTVDSLQLVLNKGELNVYSFKNGIRSTEKYHAIYGLNFACDQENNFRSRYTFQYPIIGEKEFDKTMAGQAEKWKGEIKSKFDKTYYSDPANIPSDRFKYEAFVWTELDYFGKDFISGNLYYQNSWSDEVQKFCFNYDRKKDKFLDRDQLIANEINLESLQKNFTPPSNKKLEYLNFNLEGLVMRSDSDIVYGQEVSYIPWSKLGNTLNEKISFLSKMVK